MHMMTSRVGLVLAAIVAFIGHGGGPAAARGKYEATIVRTTYGIPHIQARDHGGLGFGVGYSAGEDAVCVIAEQLVTARGERAAHFGAESEDPLGPTNVERDIYYGIVADPETIRRASANASADARALVRGFAAGYNRFLRDADGRLPAPCGGQAWVRPVSEGDVLLLMSASLMPPTFLRQVAGASPPGAASAGAVTIGLPVPHDPASGIGSNGWAFGSEATLNGRGLLVANPHYPWEGANRFRQMHLTIPGKLQVMGAGLVVTPFVAVGFNREVAWTHTVSTAQHATLFELRLDPSDPTTYLVDGRPERMTRRTLTIAVKDGAPVTRTVYATRYGPLITLPGAGLGWSRERAYALRDANQSNQRAVDTWLGIARARNVRDIRRTIGQTLGIPFTNTLAADRRGEVLYADVTAVPYVTADKIRQCGVEAGKAPPLAAQRLFVLDGARSACAWDADPSTSEPGLMPDRLLPKIIRRDFVQNSNDSYWLSNPSAPIPAASPIVGLTHTRQSFRTQSGIVEIQRRLTGTDGMGGPGIDRERAREMILANKSMAAERIADDLIAICGGDASLAAACAVLRAWDRRADLDSRGALLFFSFMRHSARIVDMFRLPFDPADPVNTPRGLSPGAAEPIQRALAAAVRELQSLKVPLDLPLGMVQAAPRQGGQVPIHGGPHAAGVLNVMQSRPTPAGLVPVHGSSYIQVVSFEADGPAADALLTYSQSTDPTSLHSADQTRAFSEKRWHRLPFTKADVARSAITPVRRVSE